MTPDPIEMMLRRLEEHTRQDATNFARMDDKLDRILEKLEGKSSQTDLASLEERVQQTELHLAKANGGKSVITYLITAAIAFFTAWFTSKQ